MAKIRETIFFLTIMSFDLKRMIESKLAFRLKMAAKPLAEKMRLLEQLSDRAAVLKRARLVRQPAVSPPL